MNKKEFAIQHILPNLRNYFKENKIKDITPYIEVLETVKAAILNKNLDASKINSFLVFLRLPDLIDLAMYYDLAIDDLLTKNKRTYTTGINKDFLSIPLYCQYVKDVKEKE